jgi:hypothetical protein
VVSILIFIVSVVAAGIGGFVLGFATAERGRKRAVLNAPTLSALEPARLGGGLKDVGRGGVLQLAGFGDALESVDLVVERHERIVIGRDEWTLLEGSYKGRTVGLEWQQALGQTHACSMKRLRVPLAEVGLTPEALQALATTRSHAHDGKGYELLAHSDKALRHENGTGFGKEHRRWVLATPDRKHVLRIEKWDDDPARASVGEAYDASNIEVLKTRG